MRRLGVGFAIRTRISNLLAVIQKDHLLISICLVQKLCDKDSDEYWSVLSKRQLLSDIIMSTNDKNDIYAMISL